MAKSKKQSEPQSVTAVGLPPGNGVLQVSNLGSVAIDSVAPPVEQAKNEIPAAITPPSSILTIDVGGTKVKMLVSGQNEPRKAPTGKGFTPAALVKAVQELTADWSYDAISLGFPVPMGSRGPKTEPGKLGHGWVGFDYAAAFGKPIKMINDAAMQALGSYDGGRMLFLGLGTGLGSALIAEHVIVPLELGNLRYDRKRTLGDVLGRRGLKEIGKKAWRDAVNNTVTDFMRAFLVDYIVVGGGNADQTRNLPHGARLGNNLNAFQGGFRLWSAENRWFLAPSGGAETPPPVRILP